VSHAIRSCLSRALRLSGCETRILSALLLFGLFDFDEIFLVPGFRLRARPDAGNIGIFSTGDARHPFRALGVQAARDFVFLLLLPGPFTIVFLSRRSASSCQNGLPCLPARLAARTAATTTATATFVPAAARSGIRRLRTRFIDRHAAPGEFGFVQVRDGLLGLFIGPHLHERKPARPSRRHVAHHAHGVHGANPAEQLFQLAFRDVIRKISNKQLTTHSIYSCIPEGNVALTP
jgi:hypothetical protein